MSTQLLEPMGEVFTRKWVVEWMLDLAGYTSEARLFERRIVEPSCGSGAFVLPVVDRLILSCQQHGVPLTDATGALYAVDLHEPSVREARRRVTERLCDAGLGEDDARGLAEGWVQHGDFLLAEGLPPADFVVGNPPYVRLEDVDAELMAAYRSRWRTMAGRADLYVAFFERGLSLLTDGGRLAFICADRWMRNAYGAGLRRLIHDGDFAMNAVIRLHDTDCFEDDVSAYPAITVIERGEQSAGVIVQATGDFKPHHVELVALNGDDTASGGAWTTAHVPGWFGPDMWPEGPPEALERLALYEQRFEPLEDVLRQTRVGIGVATGADQVYVTDDPDLVERDRMLPLVMADHVTDGTMRWTDRYLVNPWGDRGLVDLADHPRLAALLRRHEARLRGRHTARKQPSNWYRTIDRVQPHLLGTPKILLADMKNRMTPVVDSGDYYPHHNLYWITSTVWDLHVLAGLLLSDHAELFVRSYCVKMRGGTLRMQAQYLRRIHVPTPAEFTEEQSAAFRNAYARGDRDLATATAAQLYD